MLEEGAVNAIASLARDGQDIGDLYEEIEGHTFSTKMLHHLPPKPEPEPKTLAFRSLRALAGFIKENRDKLELEGCVVHVVSPQLVQLLGPLTGEQRQRFVFAQASCKDLTQGWLGNFAGQEEFVVALQSRFDDFGQRADVLKLVSSIKEEGSIEASDDGRSQAVAIKAGIHLAAQTTIPNPVKLAPYRTFREVPQPESNFVLRVRKGPVCALFEADGGAWELEAVEKVRAWLAQEIAGVPVLA